MTCGTYVSAKDDALSTCHEHDTCSILVTTCPCTARSCWAFAAVASIESQAADAQQRGRAGARRGAAAGRRVHQRRHLPALQGRGAVGPLRRRNQPRRPSGRVRRQRPEVRTRGVTRGARMLRVRAHGEARRGHGRLVRHRQQAVLSGDVSSPRQRNEDFRNVVVRRIVKEIVTLDTSIVSTARVHQR